MGEHTFKIFLSLHCNSRDELLIIDLTVTVDEVHVDTPMRVFFLNRAIPFVLDDIHVL